VTSPLLFTPDPEDPLEGIKTASEEMMASIEGGRIDAWLEEIRTRRETERSELTTEPKHSPLSYQNKGANKMSSNSKRPRTVSDLFPSKWLRHSDLKEPVTVLIAKAEIVEVYDKQSHQPVEKLALSFKYQGKPLSKRLLVNKTNAYALAAICETEEFDRWSGKTVTLAPGRSPNGKPTIIVKEAVK